MITCGGASSCARSRRVRRARAREADEFLETMWKVRAGTSFGNDKEPRKPRARAPGRRNPTWPRASTSRSCPGVTPVFTLTIPTPGLGGRRPRRGYARAEATLPVAGFIERRAQVGAMATTEPHCGSDSAALQTTRGQGRRPVGAERHQDLLHLRASWRVKNRTASSVSVGRSTRPPPRRDQVVRGASAYARDEGDQGRETSSASAPPTPR